MSTATAASAPTATTTVFGRPLRILAWLSFVTETVIIGTGGAVRLTASGLGCSEWPLCTPESLVPTPEQGLHGIIEFGNRTMTGVVLAIALFVLLLTLRAVAGRPAVVRTLVWAGASIALGLVVTLGFFFVGGLLGAHAYPDLEAFFKGPGFVMFTAAMLLGVISAGIDSVRRVAVRRDLATLAWIVLVGVVAQAFVGGITVLTGLNPFIVGFHYVSSLLLVCVTAAYLVRMNAVPGPRERAVPVWFAAVTHVTGLALAVTILFGVLTTASGPHSGDANVIRDGFDATVLAHVHSWPGYILAALLVALTAAAWILRLDLRAWMLALVGAVAVQVGVGVWQAREGLPEVLVGIHMVLAALSAAAYTVVVLRLKRPAAS